MVVWTKEGMHAFSVLRDCLCDCVCLIVPRREEVGYVLHTDASGAAIGGCLHVRRDGEELPVAFYSRQLRGPEVRYSITEKEALAVVASLDHFECYLYGRMVEVVTDHKPNLALVSGESQSGLNPRLRRFALRLMGRVETMKYLPGPELSSADGLSRMWADGLVSGSRAEKGGPDGRPRDVSHSEELLESLGPLKMGWTADASLEKGGCGGPTPPTRLEKESSGELEE